MRKIIETERLILRPFETSDLTALTRYAGEYDVAKATAQLPHPYTEAEAQAWLDYNQHSSGGPTESHIYAIVTRENSLIGCISLTAKGDGSQADWELGYWLGQPHWRKGYMREASEALLDDAKQHLAPTQLCACVFTDNPRSADLLRHLGFTSCGQSTEFSLARGHEVDAQVLTLSLEAHHA